MDASPPRGMMKHLQEAFAGARHMRERAGQVGAGAGDTQLQGLNLNLSVQWWQRSWGWDEKEASGDWGSCNVTNLK